MPRALCVFGLALSALVRGARRHSKSESVATSNADCDWLSGIVVNGKDFSEALQTVCNHWPQQLGEFPLQNLRRPTELLQAALGPGGAWDQIQDIRNSRQQRQFCWRNETLRRELTAVGAECEMESQGVCYGACPFGYRPGLLSGIFGPACTSACGASTHPVACGFGCASSFGQCARTVVDQVGSVAQGVGQVMSGITGNSKIAAVVDAVVGLAEFLLDALPSLIDAVVGGLLTINNGEEGALVAVLLFQYVMEIGPQVGETVQSIREAFQEVADIIADLTVERAVSGFISPSRIVSQILDHGEAMLQYSVRVTKVFSFERCQVAEDVVFTLENAGDERLMGPWVQRGTMNGHPKYTLKGERATIMEWDRRKKSWVMFSDNWSGVFGRKHLYQSSVQSEDYPLSGWSDSGGGEPLPEIVVVRAREEQ